VEVTRGGKALLIAEVAGQRATSSTPGPLSLEGVPNDVAVDAHGAVYVYDASRGLARIAPGGAVSWVGPMGVRPIGAQIAVTTSGDVYVVCFTCVPTGTQGTDAVYVIRTNGSMSTFAGGNGPGYSGDGGPATNARLNAPHGVAVDKKGNVYFSDAFDHVIRRVSATGVITTVAGNGTPGYSGDGGPATSAQLNEPTKLALDASGNLFIIDSGNHRIRELTVDGIIRTVAGNGFDGDAGDGGPASAAAIDVTFGATSAIALDATGNLYVAEGRLGHVRKVSPGGTITKVI
jgi:sugar lactone lactonase YvrE